MSKSIEEKKNSLNIDYLVIEEECCEKNNYTKHNLVKISDKWLCPSGDDFFFWPPGSHVLVDMMMLEHMIPNYTTWLKVPFKKIHYRHRKYIKSVPMQTLFKFFLGTCIFILLYITIFS